MGWKAVLGLAAVGVVEGAIGLGMGEPKTGGDVLADCWDGAWEEGDPGGGFLRAGFRGLAMLLGISKSNTEEIEKPASGAAKFFAQMGEGDGVRLYEGLGFAVHL